MIFVHRLLHVKNFVNVHHAHIIAILRWVRLLSYTVVYILVVDCQWDVQFESKYSRRFGSPTHCRRRCSCSRMAMAAVVSLVFSVAR
ncbi:unnamed protein product [Linum trigynum]|uniref:Secreted protein n=1 Tax=Linum trigynum TaxID=586398 RepID=A0AAV2D523_9ROSI